MSIGLALRHAQHALGPASIPTSSRTLDDAVAEITVAIDELRELARGLRPAQLDAGLGPALRDLARRAPLPVEVDATGDRFPTDVETAAYFTACEGLTNAVKHAHATKVQLAPTTTTAGSSSPWSTTASAAPSPATGSGLTGLADRVAAHGGTLTIDSDKGTRHHPHRGVPVRVVIAEDQALLREGLARLFRDGGHDVVATLGDADQLLATIEQEHPDLAVVDIRMPPTFTDEGARAARAIKEQHPDVGVLVLSQHIETTHAVNLVTLGGFGYLLKDRVLEVGEFLATAERVAAGGSALDPMVVANLVSPADTARRPALRARTRRARAHGPRSHQRRHRQPARRQRTHRRGPRPPHPHQARHPRERRRPPPRARRPHLPQRHTRLRHHVAGRPGSSIGRRDQLNSARTPPDRRRTGPSCAHDVHRTGGHGA